MLVGNMTEALYTRWATPEAIHLFTRKASFFWGLETVSLRCLEFMGFFIERCISGGARGRMPPWG